VERRLIENDRASPKMSLCECAARAGFQVLLEGHSTTFVSELDRHLDDPRFAICGMRTAAVIVGADPMLAQHLHALLMFQWLAITSGFGWNRFVQMVDQVLPKRGTTLPIPFEAPTGQ
jgi:hypothetical protein